MARYRRKPIEVEAVQVKSGEPVPDWWLPGPFWRAPKLTWWLIRFPDGYRDMMSPEEFEANYELIDQDVAGSPAGHHPTRRTESKI